MKTKKAAIETAIRNTDAKLHNPSDLWKVLQYFKYKTATTLDCMLETGILRNSITWYVDYAEKEGLIQMVRRAPDRNTGYMAGYYSADPIKWPKRAKKPLNLFKEDDFA